MRNPFSSHRFVTIAGSLAAVVSIAAIAQAATDTIYRYTTPRNGVLQLSAVGFTPLSPDVDYSIEWSGGRILLNSQPSEYGCFTSGVNLPHGATIISVVGILASGGSADDEYHPVFSLARHTNGNGNFEEIATRTIRDNAGAMRGYQAPVQQTLRTVNNNSYSYGFVACLPTTADYFHGAKIAYTYTHAGD